jgi:MATE family multidrug resistance protein
LQAGWRREKKPLLIQHNLFNITFDYLLIFGNAGFPAMGITGAGLATSLSAVLTLILFIILIFNRRHNQNYHTLRGFRFDSALFRRLLLYSVPSGVQFFLDVSGFALFVLLVGKLGIIPLAATNITFSINMFAFMPITGVSIAVSILVGQAIGEHQPALAQKSVYSAFHISFIYIATVALVFIVFPDLFLSPYAAGTNPADFSRLRAIAIVLLRFVAFYSLFDSLNLIFSAGIKGAGTRPMSCFPILHSPLVSW